MGSSLPHSAATTTLAAANAAAAAAIGSTSKASIPTIPFVSSEQANNLRVAAVSDRLLLFLNGVARFDASEVYRLCHSLAKGIDCAITLNNVPEVVPSLPKIIKMVYEWSMRGAPQPAIMLLLISIKNACSKGWFENADREELLQMVNELGNKFCTEACLYIHVSNAFDTISTIMPKFYPRLKLCRVITSFEAKLGYDVLMSDFHIPKMCSKGERIVLIVIKMENLETSSCIANPQHVSFFVNGTAVEKRSNVSLEHGPQFPTDITKMLKFGINVLQAIGFFDGTYLIAVAFMSRMTTFTPPEPKEFVPPAVVAVESDAEIIEGPSRISLCCPISFKRMKTPVKGHLCKHHQCFDYDNFVEMNSRKPNWRCPHCNQPTCFNEIRIDKNMVKILKEVGDDVAEVVIHADGSWSAVAAHDRCTDQYNGTDVQAQAEYNECQTSRSNDSMAGPVDLTMEEEDDCDTMLTSRQEESWDGFARENCNALETGDRKPIIDVSGLSTPPFLASQPHAPAIPSCQLLSGMQLTNIYHPANGSIASAGPHVGTSQAGSNMDSPALDHVSNVTERISGSSIPTHANRNPVAVQALPVPQHTPSTTLRLQANLLETASLTPSNLSPRQLQRSHASTAILDTSVGGVSNLDVQQIRRIADTSTMQDNSQAQLCHHHVVNAANLQQTVGLPSPNLTSGRSPALSQRRARSDLDALRASLQPSLYIPNSHRTPPGFRPRYPMAEPTNLHFSRPSVSSALHPASPNTVSSGTSNLSNPRNHAQALRPILPVSTVNLHLSREGLRVVGADRWRNLTGGSSSSPSRSDVLPELPSEQNWRPTGRMRGSLTGNEKTAILSHFLAPLTTQSAATEPSLPSHPPSTFDTALVASNNLMAYGSLNQQANLRQNNLGDQLGSTRIRDVP
ncbi:E3 SUMO-protein ligase SIZ2 [Apostasia shenzhenica]|uniref:E3 SUMO-protein ligase SIZ2 n=1 Tax=Apostasia shenzhenica TaxID=1088818 RepID=A0A2I0BAA9_9ASPA|nr:E3 SUMO-protein ligase SIZ2 [Apostasia shenzhenica]